MGLGRKIAELRKQNNLSQQDLANKLNVSNKTISKWECGNSVPDIEILNSLAKIFNVSIDKLVNEQDDFNKKEDTNNVISSAVKESIDKLVGGADEAFDTLKEISDWILSQNRYVEVTPQEVIDNWKENTYFTFNINYFIIKKV